MAKIDFGQFRFGGMPGGQGGKTWTVRSEMPGKKVFSGMSHKKSNFVIILITVLVAAVLFYMLQERFMV